MPTDEEEADIQRGIAADPDNPEWTEDDFAAARPASDALPELVASRKRGAQRAPRKVMIALRLDPEVLDRLRASGRGWQTRASEALSKMIMGD